MILVAGGFVAKEGRLTEALRLSVEHVRRSRLEGGCISHAVHQDVENPSHLVFVEQWADRAALSAHFAVPASREFVRAIAGLAVAAPALCVYEASQVAL
jgi:quinol monooxygenase YgiN